MFEVNRSLIVCRFIVLLVSLTLLIGGSESGQNEEILVYDAAEMKTIAWDSLPEKVKTTVNHPVQQANVVLFKATDPQYALWITSPAQSGKNPFVAVTFLTVDDGRLGPITIYIDPRSKEIVGHIPRF